MRIAYVEHPVTAAEKKEYLKDFDKIIDIRYAPNKLESGSKKFEKPKADSKKTSSNPTAAEIIDLIKVADSEEAISQYAEDTRKTVKEAYEEKMQELSE